MESGFHPRVGEVMLLERDGDADPLTAIVLSAGDTGVVGELASPTTAAPGGPVLVSVFAPEALYRVGATLDADREGQIHLSEFHDLETIQRRRWPRREMTMPVSLIPADDDAPVGVLGETVDISVGGARVTTSRPLPAGADPLVALTLPDGEVLVLASRVVHAETGPDRCAYRLAFQDLDGNEAAHLAELVAAIPA